MHTPFEGLTPAPGTEHGRWVHEALAERAGIAREVPGGFEAYARIMHRGREGDLPSSIVDALVPILEAGTSTPNRCHFALWVGWGGLHPESSGIMSAGPIDESSPSMQRYRADQAMIAAFVTSCPVGAPGQRDLALFDGPVSAVATIGTASPSGDRLSRQSPQWWWPEDRAWFVATDIDSAWSSVGGSADLVAAMSRSERA